MLAPRGVSPSFQEFSIGSSNFKAWRSGFHRESFWKLHRNIGSLPKTGSGNPEEGKGFGQMGMMGHCN
jgi:hypothetical protein